MDVLLLGISKTVCTRGNLCSSIQKGKLEFRSLTIDEYCRKREGRRQEGGRWGRDHLASVQQQCRCYQQGETQDIMCVKLYREKGRYMRWMVQTSMSGWETPYNEILAKTITMDWWCNIKTLELNPVKTNHITFLLLSTTSSTGESALGLNVIRLQTAPSHRKTFIKLWFIQSVKLHHLSIYFCSYLLMKLHSCEKPSCIHKVVYFSTMGRNAKGRTLFFRCM